ncbi:uncharacterized protein [Antedon mediterranea]|uniref:uncharacterized protein n=1 Tax=Antedon mediterranea TaxID=105859 RepID=UPI003AF9081A
MSSILWYTRYELKQAMRNGDLKKIERICREHPDILKTTDENGDTPLHLYLWYEHCTLEIVEFLIQQHSASLSLQNQDGNTPLHLYLSLYDTEPTSEILIACLVHDGKSLLLQNKYGDTPLHLYVSNRYCTLEIVEFLIQQHGASLSLQNKDGDTPLHLYVSNRYCTLEIVEFLIQQHGASLSLQNKEGNTPVNILEKNAYISEKEKNKIAIYFDKLLVPAEVYSKGKDAIKIYKDELQNGEISVVNSRCMFLGKEGAGKTSCVKAMLGERFNSREPSTDGIVTTTVFQATTEDCSTWNEVTDVDGVELSKKVRAHALAENVDKKLGKESNDTTIVGQLLNIWMKIIGKEKANVSDITSIWDYAGQLDYYITHRFFLTNKVSYCVTFNVMDNLNELANPRDSTIESLGMTNLDMNFFWVRSIYEHTVLQHGSGNPVFVDDKSIESPPICLVATHMDKLSGTKLEKQMKAEEMFMQMFDAMKGMPYAKHVDREMYMVDNTVKSHEGIIKLKRNVGRHMKEMVRKVPVKWVELQEKLQIIGKTRLSITLTEVSEIATQCNISKHVLTTVIMYLNDTGIILYTGTNEKLRNIVITNLLWMIKILTKVITVVTPTIKVKKAEDRKQLQMLWEKLSNEGVLEEKLLCYLWRNEDEDLFDVFVELMKVFRLLFEKTKGIEEGNRVFLVPCRMKVDKKDFLKVKADDTQTVSIYLTPTDFLPDAVYNTLVVAFLELMTEKGSDDSEVFRNRSDFKFSNHTVSLGSVRIYHEKEKPHALKLEILRRTEVVQSIVGDGKKTKLIFKPEPSVCMEVLSYLKEQLKTVCNIYEGIGYNLRVLCTACNPKEYHLIDLDKCLKNDSVPCGRRTNMNTAHIKRFFLTEPMLQSVSEPEPMLQPESVSEPEPMLQPESVSEPELMLQPESVSEPEPLLQPESVSESEPMLQPESVSESEPMLQPESVSEPEPMLQPESVSEPEPMLQPESVSESEPMLQPESVSEPMLQPESVSEPEPMLQPESVSEPEPMLQPESVSESLSRAFGESSKEKFQTMLVQVSNWYDEHDSLDMLKVLCKDLITPYNALQKADTTMELFNLLKKAGHLHVTNFKVLIDIINVTGTKGALEDNKYLKNAFDESDHHVTTVTTYRQKLIDFGNTLSQDNVTTLIHLNNVSRKQRENQWIVILDLEQRGILREDRLLSFIEHLKKNNMTVAAEKLE